MKPTVLNILSNVFTLVASDAKILRQPRVITSRLKQQGVSEDQINEALLWLASFFEYDQKAYLNIPKNRILTEIEMKKVGSEGYAFLTKLSNMGVLPPGKREFLLDRLMSANTGCIGINQIKMLTFITLVHDKKHIEEVRWIESIILKETSEKATLLH